MLVVSDASPITSLIQVGRIEYLRELFGAIVVLTAVHDELARFHATIPSFIEVRQVADRSLIGTLRPRLDLGEAEAILLAAELHADRLLIDEHRGRLVAVQMGIPIIGLVGTLLAAKEQKLITSVSECIFELQDKAGFYISKLLIEKALKAAGE